MSLSLEVSAISIPSTMVAYHETEHSAIVTAISRDELLEWWQSNKNTKPFTQLVADRIDLTPADQQSLPPLCRLRVGLGYKNKGVTITAIFQATTIQLQPRKELDRLALLTTKKGIFLD